MNAENTSNFMNTFREKSRIYGGFVFIVLLTLAIYFTSFYEFLLFHSIIEMTGIAITLAIFLIFWNSKDAIDNNFFTLLGISFLFMGLIDLLHTLAYKGVGIFLEFDANLPTQLWIAGRFLQSISLLLAILLLGKKISTSMVYLAFISVTTILLTLIFTGYFPDCYIEGAGLTTFKIVSEFVICVLYISSVALLFFRRSNFSSATLYFIVTAVSFAILGEIFFCLYFDVTGTFNILGHLARFISIYFFYRATAREGLKNPIKLLFQHLQDQHLLRLRSLIENLPEGIVLLDEEYKIIIKNPAAIEFLPYLVIDQSIDKILNIADYPIEKVLTAIDSDLKYHEINLDSPINKVFNVGGIKITEGAQKGDTILVIRDITFENNIRKRAQTQDKLASIGELSRGISHDFKNILWTITGAAELIETEAKDENIRTFGNLILAQTAKGAELINQILDYSGQSKAHEEVFDLKPVIEETVKLAVSSLPVNISLDTSLETFKVKLNRVQFQQILLNLIVNSKDALKQGGNIQISTKLVQSSEIKDIETINESIPDCDFVNIRIFDDGDGISKKDLKKVFEPFYTTKPSGEGSGLGLAQVYGLTRQHNGYINMESKKGEYTQVDIFFPLCDS